MDAYRCIAQVGDLSYMGYMIVVTMGKNYHLDLIFILCDHTGKYRGINEHVSGKIRISQKPPTRDPPHWHAE